MIAYNNIGEFGGICRITPYTISLHSSGAERLNREVGVKPTRSRRCNGEQTLTMSLDADFVWEGKASDEPESEELPVEKSPHNLRTTGRDFVMSILIFQTS